MIFDDGYDRALWFLVANNKRDSERVCNLIRFIPEYVYVDIQNAIMNFNSSKGDRVYNVALSNVDGYDCYVEVLLKKNKLYLILRRWIGDVERIEEEYELVLRNISNEMLVNMKYGDAFVIGRYSSAKHDIRKNGYCSETSTIGYDGKYGITRVPFGFFVTPVKMNIGVMNKYVNLFKDKPEEMFIDDFSDRESVSRLVKKRKRDKYNRGV